MLTTLSAKWIGLSISYRTPAVTPSAGYQYPQCPCAGNQAERAHEQPDERGVVDRHSRLQNRK
jgi:hypothetical protein